MSLHLLSDARGGSARPGRTSARLVVDWDGTVTTQDTLALVMERFGDLPLYRQTGLEMGRSLTHDEAIALSFTTVRASLDEVVGWLLATVRLRPGFPELVDEHRPLIVSSGFEQLIRPILAREGLDAELLANRVDPRPDGWRVEFRERAICAACGEPCKRAALPAGEVVYVGDGYSDRCAALAAERVFATAGLAADLARQRIPYRAFADFHDVRAGLAADRRGGAG
jgi:2-hydroxy-3-keto-5-methylthiopentenyl-1-phosphate phosphatase